MADQEDFEMNYEPRAAVISGMVAGDQVAEVALPPDEPVTFGRAATCGVQVPRSAHSSKVSNVIATFTPTPLGWVLTNGHRTRVNAQSPFILGGSFGPKAQVLLQLNADWVLNWDFDVVTELSVRYRPADGVQHLPIAHDRAPKELPSKLPLTVLAGDGLELTPQQRRRLGALFAYRIEGAAKPTDLLGNAAALIGDSERQILNTAIKVRERLNQQRHVEITHLDDLGYHLVEVAGILGADDLP